MNCRICNSSAKIYTELGDWPTSAQLFPHSKEGALCLRGSISIFQCENCGHVQLDHEPVSYYKRVIRSAGFSNGMKEYRRNQFKQILSRYYGDAKEITALEIGAGNGEYADIMVDLGIRMLTLDIQEDCANKGYAGHIVGFLETEYWEEIKRSLHKMLSSRLDFIYCLNFIEHWPDPLSSLRLLHDVVEDDSVFLFEVPNSEMIINRGLFSELIGDHLHYFTISSFTSLVSKAGYEIISVERTYEDYIITITCKKSKNNARNKMSLFAANYKSFSKRFNKFVVSSDKNLVVWGASHQTLVYLCAIPWTEQILGIVDNAVFKQGKYAIGSGYYIYPVSKLSELRPERLLVSCGGYSQEVLKISKNYIPESCATYYINDNGEICEYVY